MLITYINYVDYGSYVNNTNVNNELDEIINSLANYGLKEFDFTGMLILETKV